ncbi:MAG: glycosyltransferase family 4 protein [Chloroflexota bacterium]|nr:glycosyltransferase family 4 protein [Chloroflexota bacterium]
MNVRTLLVIGDRIDARAVSDAPRRDFDVLAERLGADVLHAGALDGGEGRARSGFGLARLAAARARAYDAVYCDSEHIGIPLALLLRGARPGPRLTVLAHYLTPLKKRALIRLLRPQGRIDCLVVHSQAQARRARSLGFGDGKLTVVPYQVDAAFWRPQPGGEACIASAGQEFRDYLTLMRAVEGRAVEVRIAAGSHWSTRRATFSGADVPANVTVRRRSYVELRDLYASAPFVVVPLLDVDFQAGIITILEAMAMGKCVVVSRTRGQRGVVSGPLMRHGTLSDIGEHAWPEDTGIYVPPGDATSLGDAIDYLLARPDRARAMGAAARRQVEAGFTVEQFAERLGGLIAPGTTRAAMPAGASS